MRFLNKIIFINSASIPYAEIKLDGNIHFIGTQGVGKSTVLRAILYFYNADGRKLGIPKGPTAKSFADWYLAYGNSFIVYEVQRETGAYCVLAFKSQNRVCYRFIDTAYKAEYFIDTDGQAYSNWENIREKLDRDRINVSTQVSSYEQYRDILYGNYLGRSEFKKYSLLEAKQFNNIYRTIQNVFLNTKLDANEIKQTIISSMEEERIAVDLDKYQHHLKDFESELSDIKRFREAAVMRYAKNSSNLLAAIRVIDREKLKFVKQLNWRLDYIQTEKPRLAERKTAQEALLGAQKENKRREQELHLGRKDKITASISQLNGEIKKASKKKAYYESKNIAHLIASVAREADIKLQQAASERERSLLTQAFSSISNKYKALIGEQENQLSAYINQKEQEKVAIGQQELLKLDRLNQEYDALLHTLSEEHERDLQTKEEEKEQRTEAVHKLDKEKTALQHKVFFQKEIELASQQIEAAKLALQKEQNNIEHYKQQLENRSLKWEFEKAEAQNSSKQEHEKQKSEWEQTNAEIRALQDKIDSSKDSLYGWLTENKAGWQENIGKVIQPDLLYRDGLSPKVVQADAGFYGIAIDLKEIDQQVKSTEDHRFELSKLHELAKQLQTALDALPKALASELEKIQRRHLPKIKEFKTLAKEAEFKCQQLGRDIEKHGLEKSTWLEKAKTQKQEALQNKQAELELARQQKQESADLLRLASESFKRNKTNKQREKERRAKAEKQESQAKYQALEEQIESKRKSSAEKIAALTADRNKELNEKGVDTQRLSNIEKQLVGLENELKYIAENRDIVVEYRKDKRELFDKLKDFKNEIALHEQKRNQLDEKFQVLKNKLNNDIRAQEQLILETEKLIGACMSDEIDYERFKLSDVYGAIQAYLQADDKQQTTLTARQLIDEINQKHYQRIERERDLQSNINKFLSKFSTNNIFKFPSKPENVDAYLSFADELNDFIEDGKIIDYEKRTNERFAYIIHTIGKETALLISKTGDIKKIINKINQDFRQKNFVTAVSHIELDITNSKNTAVMLLKRIKDFNDEHAMSLGEANLFSGINQSQKNEEAVDLLKQLVKETNLTQKAIIELADSFELSFRIEENGNNTGWVEKLTNVGSEGTDVLVKAMINIMLLNVFKEGASRKFKDFKLHCMMDEIGKLHPTNVKGILKFANDRNILLINGSPTENTPLSYRHIYKMHKNQARQTKIMRIVSNRL